MKVLQILFIFFTISSGIFILMQCNQDFPQKTHPISPQIYTSVLDREAEIQKCAKCHEKEYNEWLAGPHAQAYKSLMMHKKHVSGNKNFSENYKKFLTSDFSKVCNSCHTGKNLYENSFNGLASCLDSTKYNSTHFPRMFEHATAREGDENKILNSGVDCLTCHRQGHKVVTGKNGKSGIQNGKSCDLLPSQFYSSNQNCFTCHHTQVESMTKLINSNKLGKNTDCLQCHLAKDHNGKTSHYFYWRKDSIGTIRPKTMNVFNSIDISYSSLIDSVKLEFSWQNKHIPHTFSECGEAVAQIVVLSAKNDTILQYEKRVNNRINFRNKQDVPHFQEGVDGYQFFYKSTPLKQIDVIGKIAKGGKVIITGLVKPQYWSNDVELEKVFDKEISIEL